MASAGITDPPMTVSVPLMFTSGVTPSSPQTSPVEPSPLLTGTTGRPSIDGLDFPNDIPDGANSPPLVAASADKNERRLDFDLKLITDSPLFEPGSAELFCNSAGFASNKDEPQSNPAGRDNSALPLAPVADTESSCVTYREAAYYHKPGAAGSLSNFGDFFRAGLCCC